jgi:beta-lactamase class A
MNRLMLADNGLQNYTGAEDCARFLAAVYRGDCVSPEASREMLELLLAQTVNDRLPARLPEGMPVAHKTGDLSGLCCADVGIVFSPGGDYILCLICNDPPTDSRARDAIVRLSGQVYGIVNPS